MNARFYFSKIVGATVLTLLPLESHAQHSATQRYEPELGQRINDAIERTQVMPRIVVYGTEKQRRRSPILSPGTAGSGPRSGGGASERGGVLADTPREVSEPPVTYDDRIKLPPRSKAPEPKRVQIKGSDWKTVSSALNKVYYDKAQGKGFWAKAISHMGAVVDAEPLGKRFRIKAINISVAEEMIWPEWDGLKDPKVPQCLRNNFAVMLTPLSKHENKHLQIARDVTATELSKRLAALPADFKSERDAIRAGEKAFLEALAEASKAQEKYDLESGHGVKEGVRFDDCVPGGTPSIR